MPRSYRRLSFSRNSQDVPSAICQFAEGNMGVGWFWTFSPKMWENVATGLGVAEPLTAMTMPNFESNLLGFYWDFDSRNLMLIIFV